VWAWLTPSEVQGLGLWPAAQRVPSGDLIVAPTGGGRALLLCWCLGLLVSDEPLVGVLCLLG